MRRIKSDGMILNPVNFGVVGMIAASVVFALVMDFVVFPDPPDVPEVIPEGHHAAYEDYQWKVTVDPIDENWQFYTDTQPAFSFQSTDGGEAQTVVCMKNVREKLDGKDRYYTGGKPRCVGGEGKIDIDPQGSLVKY